MLQLEHIQYIWLALLIIIPILLYQGYKKWQSNYFKKFGNPDIIKYQFFGSLKSNIYLKAILPILALLLMVFAVLNLRKGSGTEQTSRKGLDVMIALDVSKSMLAMDMSPNRLDRSKTFIRQLLDELQNDRVGLVVFAGKAYLQAPLTIDYNALNMLLESVNPDLIPTQGTVLSEAIDLSSKSFNRNENKYKVLVLISDGEDHDANAIDAVKDVVKQGVVVYTVGVGSPQGAQIIDQSGNPKLDESGQIVVSKLNEKILQDIAATGHGHYQLLYNTKKVAQKLKADINGMEKRNQGTVVFTQYKSYFQIFIGLAIILLLIEGLLPRAKDIRTYKKI